jgi:hypothetical protein
MRRPRLTQRRWKAILAALLAMDASEEPGAGDWPEDVTKEDMEGAIEAARARVRRPEFEDASEEANRISMEMEKDYLAQQDE